MDSNTLADKPGRERDGSIDHEDSDSPLSDAPDLLLENENGSHLNDLLVPPASSDFTPVIAPAAEHISYRNPHTLAPQDLQIGEAAPPPCVPSGPSAIIDQQLPSDGSGDLIVPRTVKELADHNNPGDVETRRNPAQEKVKNLSDRLRSKDTDKLFSSKAQGKTIEEMTAISFVPMDARPPATARDKLIDEMAFGHSTCETKHPSFKTRRKAINKMAASPSIPVAHDITCGRCGRAGSLVCLMCGRADHTAFRCRSSTLQEQGESPGSFRILNCHCQPKTKFSYGEPCITCCGGESSDIVDTQASRAVGAGDETTNYNSLTELNDEPSLGIWNTGDIGAINSSKKSPSSIPNHLTIPDSQKVPNVHTQTSTIKSLSLERKKPADERIQAFATANPLPQMNHPSPTNVQTRRTALPNFTPKSHAANTQSARNLQAQSTLKSFQISNKQNIYILNENEESPENTQASRIVGTTAQNKNRWPEPVVSTAALEHTKIYVFISLTSTQSR